MNKEAIDLLISQNPKLAIYREKLESMQPGSYCIHRSWGFGKIEDYDERSNKLLIDFANRDGLQSMDPAFCIDKLEVLPHKHILVRQCKEPEVVRVMIKEKPAEVVISILEHSSNNMISSVELQKYLLLLLGNDFKKWWNSSKKALIKDHRIAIPAKKTDPYVLREKPLSPEQEVLEEFYIHKNPKNKIALAEKLYQFSESVKEIEEDLPQILNELTEAIQGARQLTQAERLHGVWVRNDLARHLHEDVDLLEPTSSSLIRETEDLSSLAELLPSSYQKRFLDLITRVYPDEWPDICLNLLKNSAGRFTGECVSFLCDRKDFQFVSDALTRWLNEQTIRGPVIHWIIKNRKSKRYSTLVEHLITPRLLNAIFYAIDYEALQISGNRRIPLADLLNEDKTIVQDLLKGADYETAHDLAQSLLLNQGFEDLNKKSILARFIKQFSKIQSLVAGESRSKESDALFVSKESLDVRKKEYETLINEKISKNKKDIEIAKEHGDLRENAEYKMARQDQETLMARKAQLEQDFALARVTDFKNAPTDRVGVGSLVELNEASSGKKHQYAILGAWDSNPDKNILSYKTPLGQSLLGKKVGDTVSVEVSGNKENWTILKISRWIDKQ